MSIHISSATLGQLIIPRPLLQKWNQNTNQSMGASKSKWQCSEFQAMQAVYLNIHKYLIWGSVLWSYISIHTSGCVFKKVTAHFWKVMWLKVKGQCHMFINMWMWIRTEFYVKIQPVNPAVLTWCYASRCCADDHDGCESRATLWFIHIIRENMCFCQPPSATVWLSKAMYGYILTFVLVMTQPGVRAIYSWTFYHTSNTPPHTSIPGSLRESKLQLSLEDWLAVNQNLPQTLAVSWLNELVLLMPDDSTSWSLMHRRLPKFVWAWRNTWATHFLMRNF